MTEVSSIIPCGAAMDVHQVTACSAVVELRRAVELQFEHTRFETPTHSSYFITVVDKMWVASSESASARRGAGLSSGAVVSSVLRFCSAGSRDRGCRLWLVWWCSRRRLSPRGVWWLVAGKVDQQRPGCCSEVRAVLASSLIVSKFPFNVNLVNENIRIKSIYFSKFS